jgi:2-polyprenyl-3-methyl-5-hydroxy-6-metoxy-1,4-benzoquinol methylase
MAPVASHAEEQQLNDARFEVHSIEWSREKSARFWNYVCTRPWYQQNYFSRLVGRAILAMARTMGVRLRGRVLDFGCGPGYLLDLLVAQGVACEGADFSENAIAILNERLRHEPLFGGVTRLEQIPSSLPADAYDVVFCIELVEHLLDDDLETTVAELGRILKPGGTLVLTTPNEEDLAVTEAFCPDCGCSFSRNQHLRSWSAQTLTEFMRARGFRCTNSRRTYFRSTLARTMLIEAITRLRRRKLPHLIWVGQKA